jgi:hypothetical protein
MSQKNPKTKTLFHKFFFFVKNTCPASNFLFFSPLLSSPLLSSPLLSSLFSLLSSLFSLLSSSRLPYFLLTPLSGYRMQWHMWKIPLS